MYITESKGRLKNVFRIFILFTHQLRMIKSSVTRFQGHFDRVKYMIKSKQNVVENSKLKRQLVIHRGRDNNNI